MYKKIIYKIIPVVIVLLVIVTNVVGFGDGFDPSIVPVGDDVDEIKAPINRIWGTVSLILQMCSVAGVIITGIRYMFAGPDAKADMKKTLPLLITGMVIVFASTYVIEFVVKIVEDVTK